MAVDLCFNAEKLQGYLSKSTLACPSFTMSGMCAIHYASHYVSLSGKLDCTVCDGDGSHCLHFCRGFRVSKEHVVSFDSTPWRVKSRIDVIPSLPTIFTPTRLILPVLASHIATKDRESLGQFFACLCVPFSLHRQQDGVCTGLAEHTACLAVPGKTGLPTGRTKVVEKE